MEVLEDLVGVLRLITLIAWSTVFLYTLNKSTNHFRVICLFQVVAFVLFAFYSPGDYLHDVGRVSFYVGSLFLLVVLIEVITTGGRYEGKGIWHAIKHKTGFCEDC